MEYFFHPKGVAVIGATPNPFKSGNTIVRNLNMTFEGGIYPVNPKYDIIEGRTCYPSVSSIPDPIDLAIIFVPADGVVTAVEECAAKGIPGVMIQSGGFAEVGGQGREIENRLAQISKETGIRIWGPNCMGLIDAVSGYIFSFAYADDWKNIMLMDKISFIVQSGLISTGFMFDNMMHHTSGISKVCSIGNKLDINECDLLPILLKDSNTNVVGLYLESIADGRRLIEICRSTQKPIVMLKGGKSVKGSQAAMSHTASLAGNHSVIEGVLKQVGIIEANDFSQMTDLCRALSYFPECHFKKGNIAIMTFSGAAGIISADFLEHFNLDLSEMSLETKDLMEKYFPEWMPVNNPIDLWPALEKNMGSNIDIIGNGLEFLTADPNVDAVIVTTFAAGEKKWFNVARAAACARKSGKPVFIWVLGDPEKILELNEDCRKHGLPAFRELYRLVECLKAVLGNRPRSASHVPSTSNAPVLPASLKTILEKTTGSLDEHVSKQILSSYGIPTVDEVILEKVGDSSMADSMGYPVVMKGLVSEGIHKTEMGLVELGIKNKTSVEKTFKILKKKMAGRGKVLLQRQIPGKIELILGLIRDPQFGPCVMFGLGGIMAEVFKDTVFAMAPLSEDDALRLISRIKGQTLLNGFRGMPPVNRKELARILMALGEIGMTYPRIREIDVNPLIVGDSTMAAVDATIVLE